MKKILLVLLFALYSNIYSTEQIPDLLIINKDTVLLDSSPLSQLLFKSMPFGKSAPILVVGEVIRLFGLLKINDYF